MFEINYSEEKLVKQSECIFPIRTTDSHSSIFYVLSIYYKSIADCFELKAAHRQELENWLLHNATQRMGMKSKIKMIHHFLVSFGPTTSSWLDIRTWYREKFLRIWSAFILADPFLFLGFVSSFVIVFMLLFIYLVFGTIVI